MNDFFNPDEVSTPESEAALAEERAKIQAEVFEGTPAKFEETSEATTADDSEAETTSDKVSAEDETSSKVAADSDLSSQPELPPEMQAIVDSVNKLTSSINGIENRVKQTERRVGSISNEFYAARDAAKEATPKAPAPTAAEMAEAAKTIEAWEDLKKDFPSWATAIDSKLKAETAKFVSVDDFEALRASMSKIPTVDTNQLETRLVGIIHPDWKEITQDPNYAAWLNVQSDDLKTKAYQGTTAEEAIDVFNQFKAYKVSQSTSSATSNPPSDVKQIQAQRKQRLAAATTPSTNHKTIKQKSPDDMTEEELREHIAKQVFASS